MSTNNCTTEECARQNREDTSPAAAAGQEVDRLFDYDDEAPQDLGAASEGFVLGCLAS